MVFRGENPERMEMDSKVWNRIRITDGHQTDSEQMVKEEQKDQFYDLSF